MAVAITRMISTISLVLFHQRANALVFKPQPYLLGARKELPEMCYSLEANTISTEEQGPDQPQAFLEKVEFRVPLDTTDKNKPTTYVDHFYTEKANKTTGRHGIQPNASLIYEGTGKCEKQTAVAPSISLEIRSAHSVGWMCPSQTLHTIQYARKTSRNGQNICTDTRDPDNVCINLPKTPHFDDIRSTRKARAVSLQRVPTKLISPIIHNHIHLSSATDDMWASNSALSGQQSNGPAAPQPLKRTFALYMESDEETDGDEPPQDIDNILTTIHSRYPAMDFPRNFYVEKVGMTEGATFTFHTCVRQASMKEERVKARRKAKGKKRAQVTADDAEKENVQVVHSI
ncbi:hypothetical protein EDD22DRAFT_851414 [Suillus occidentalis]|nr:hypothetical protein EDD22DRAFT_851414 [Suillus occidentalis]